MGAWLCSGYEGFVKRYDRAKDGWTHWKVVLTRGRYSDCAIITVECKVYRAKRPTGEWIVEKEPEVTRKVYLGNVRFDGDRMRTPREEKTEDDPKVIAELKAAFGSIKRHIDIAAQHEAGFRHQEIDVCVILACLKSEQSRAIAA